ncbi:fatty acyl-CoA reductase 1-like [Lycorma delicatula]|uniref:fatty acyl-CoA reductase 1-like n=1 Tax=Lycorma delicatula TaxID=130591 RepID=UPI003F519B00
MVECCKQVHCLSDMARVMRSKCSPVQKGKIYSKVNPLAKEKVSRFSGDCNKLMLGRSIADQQVLQENATIIIHSAATVRFDENIKKAVSINVIATRHLLVLNKIKHLKKTLTMALKMPKKISGAASPLITAMSPATEDYYVKLYVHQLH